MEAMKAEIKEDIEQNLTNTGYGGVAEKVGVALAQTTDKLIEAGIVSGTSGDITHDRITERVTEAVATDIIGNLHNSLGGKGR
jgi:hypothetical protein